MIVNIRDDSFSCLQMDRYAFVISLLCLFTGHITCRDVWKDEYIEDIVRCSFTFWQQQSVSDYGKQFCNLYKVLQLVHSSQLLVLCLQH
jgi:hypothetical protein